MTADSQKLPLTSHLDELRKRLVIACAAWLVAFLACYNFAEDLFKLIAEPANAALPEGSTLVFISATEPFFAYLKVAAIAGLLVSLPVILWQVWAFVAPGLKGNEKKLAIPFVTASCLCFAAGTYFGFRYVFPQIFSFLIEFGLASGQLSAMLSMAAYLSLSIHLLLAFGAVFELPVVMFFLARIGIVDHKWLAKKRKMAFLAAFVFGATLTPPDPISQLSIAGPFVILFELGIWIARLFGKKRPQS